MPEIKHNPYGGYAQEWSAYNKAQVNEKRLLRELLHELCLCVDEPEQLAGRPRLPLRDMIFSLAYKVYSTFCARRFMTDLAEAREKGLVRRLPQFNSISRYMQMRQIESVLTKLIEISSLPLVPFEDSIAIDSTGFGVRRYTRWVDERTLEEKEKREWVKVHLSCGVRTNVVGSVLVTSRRHADSPCFGRLVKGVARNFEVKEISADKAYLAAENLRQALLVGALPFIPFKANCCMDADFKSTLWRRMLYTYLYRRPEFQAHYNKRNNVETTFSMIKAKFGDTLRSKSQQAQVNEALCKVLCHNLCVLIQSMHELGIDPKFFSADAPAGAEVGAPVKSTSGGRIVAGLTATVRAGRFEKAGGKGRVEKKPQIDRNQMSLFKEDI